MAGGGASRNGAWILMRAAGLCAAGSLGCARAWSLPSPPLPVPTTVVERESTAAEPAARATPSSSPPPSWSSSSFPNEVDLQDVDRMDEPLSLDLVGRPVGRWRAGAHRGRVWGPDLGACFGRAVPAADVRRAIALNRGRVRHCYEEALRRDAETGGRVTVVFVVGLDGLVREARAEDNTTGDDELGACVAGVIASLRFPCSREAARCSYPFVLQPLDP
jgi:hypothetical protein